MYIKIFKTLFSILILVWRSPTTTDGSPLLYEFHLYHVLHIWSNPQTYCLWSRGKYEFNIFLTAICTYNSNFFQSSNLHDSLLLTSASLITNFTFQSYFKDSWNTFDFVTVLGSIVDALMVEFAVSTNFISKQVIVGWFKSYNDDCWRVP